MQYNVNDMFAAIDGCNTCTCLADTTVQCTMDACPGTCTYNGMQYNVNDMFAAIDGCNTCTCQDGGAVNCTTLPCPIK
jgi:hypothetical protein